MIDMHVRQWQADDRLRPSQAAELRHRLARLRTLYARHIAAEARCTRATSRCGSGRCSGAWLKACPGTSAGSAGRRQGRQHSFQRSTDKQATRNQRLSPDCPQLYRAVIAEYRDGG